MMEVARLSDRGYITIPDSVRRKLNLKNGDKVCFIEENGKYYITNAAMVAFDHVIDAFTGAAEESGFHSEDEMQEYMKGIRKEVRGY